MVGTGCQREIAAVQTLAIAGMNIHSEIGHRGTEVVDIVYGDENEAQGQQRSTRIHGTTESDDQWNEERQTCCRQNNRR